MQDRKEDIMFFRKKKKTKHRYHIVMDSNGYRVQAEFSLDGEITNGDQMRYLVKYLSNLWSLPDGHILSIVRIEKEGD